MKNKWKLPLIIGGAILAVFALCVFGVQSSKNKAISLEESVDEAKFDIKGQEKRRVDLVYNLADCVKRYDSYESNTITNIAESMSKGNDLENVNTALASITYSYPKLKSDENYKQLMYELSNTENLIAQYRENYNKSITIYNRYIKKFPTKIFLEWTGYEPQEYQRLDYQAPETAPQDLFGE